MVIRWPTLADVATGVEFVHGSIRDPFTQDASMSRILAAALAVVGMIVALKHPEAWQTVAAIVGGGTVALMNRSKSVPPATKGPTNDAG